MIDIVEFLKFLNTNKDGLAVIAAAIGGSVAIWRWTIDQRWRRVQCATQLIKEFMAKEGTTKALMLLDTIGAVEIKPLRKGPSRYVNVDETLLINALLTFDQKEYYYDKEDWAELSIRETFDNFFSDLSGFQHHIEAGLITVNDVKPYLSYWIGAINGYGKVHSPALAVQINRFLTEFGYDAIIRLSNSMGFPCRGQAAGSTVQIQKPAVRRKKTRTKKKKNAVAAAKKRKK